MGAETPRLALSLIRTDGGTQPRAQLDLLTVEEYAEAMRAGIEFPPVVVFHDGETHWLADGFHRVNAARKADISEIAADVRQGTRRDAVLHSVGANTSHGLRRTNADKRQAVLTLLNDPEWVKWPDGRIAAHCGVSREYVVRLKPSCDRSQDTVREVTRNGTTYLQNTAPIGRSEKPASVSTFDPGRDEWPDDPEEQIEYVAKLVDVDPEDIRRAERIKDQAPDLIEPIKNGLLTLDEAEEQIREREADARLDAAISKALPVLARPQEPERTRSPYQQRPDPPPGKPNDAADCAADMLWYLQLLAGRDPRFTPISGREFRRATFQANVDEALMCIPAVRILLDEIEGVD